MFDLNGPRTLRCILAVALYVSWTTLLVWDTPLVVEGVPSWEPEWFMFLLKGAFLLGTALSLVFRYCMRTSRFQRVGSKPLSVLMVVTPVLPGFASILECCGLSAPGGLLLAFWFLAGFGSAHLLMQANRSMLVLGTEICRAIMFISTFIAFSIGLLISSAAVSSPMFASVSMVVLPWLCFAFSHFVHSENVLEERDELYSYDIEDRAIEDKQLRHSFGRFELQLLLYSAIFSYSLFSICFGNFENMHGKLWTGVFFAGLLIMVYVTWLNQHVRIENLQWTLLLVVAIVLPLTSLSASIRQLVPVCCATLMFSFTTYDLLSISQLESFILFQKELNSRVSNTRVGRGESYELLELYSLMHPVFYYIARYLMPKSVGEIVGTMGLSIIRSAELFVSPLSDLQSDGFMTIGKLNMPTEDGKNAGAVSICSAKEKIPYYIQAINDLTQHYHQFLALPENIYRD